MKSNPYSPGAGSPPGELAGRDKLREQVRVAIARIRLGRSAKSVLMVGLRGVGKTVLLERMRVDAEESGIYTVLLEAPESRSLPALLAPQLRLVLLRLSRIRHLWAMAKLGSGPHLSGDIAQMLEKTVSSLGLLRQNLINKGIISSPSHGDAAFTVPLFDQFMKRIMASSAWKSE